MLLLLSHFSRVRLCANPQTAAHQAPRPWDSPGKNTGVGCHFLLQCMKVKSESEVAQSQPTPSNPMGCSTPGSSVHGIFQARVLEWGAIAFSGIQCYRNLNQWQRHVLNVLIWFFSSIYLVLFMLFLFLLIQVGGQDVIYKVSKVNYCQLLDNCLFNFKPQKKDLPKYNFQMIFVFLCQLISLSMIISRSNHVAANGIISFFFMAKQYSIVYIVCTTASLSIHLSMDIQVVSMSWLLRIVLL